MNHCVTSTLGLGLRPRLKIDILGPEEKLATRKEPLYVTKTRKDTEDTSLSYRSDGFVFEWLKGNKLSLNVAKAKAMVISTKLKEWCLAKNNEELSLNVQEE